VFEQEDVLAQIQDGSIEMPPHSVLFLRFA